MSLARIAELLETGSDHIFHNAAAVAANGNAVKAGPSGRLIIEIYGSVANTARTVTFYRKSRDGSFKAIQGVRTSDLTLAASTTGTGEEWEFSVTPGREYVMDLTSITGGTVTVVGTT